MYQARTNLNLLTVICIFSVSFFSCQTNKRITQQKSIPKKIRQAEDIPSVVRSNLRKEKSIYYQTIIADTGPLEASNNEVLFHAPKKETQQEKANKTKQTAESKVYHKSSLSYNDTTEPIVEKNYYVVTGSFTNRQNAVAMANEMTETGFPHVSLVYTKSFYRVVVEKFQEEKPAREFLLKFKKENPTFADAWLYSGD